MARIKKPSETATFGANTAITTNQKLVAAAVSLIDKGGEEAVTMRAVSHECGLSHNAPYKHFKSRKALLAAVARAEFLTIDAQLAKILVSNVAPPEKLNNALNVIIDYSHTYPFRYQVLFAADLSIVEPDEQLSQVVLKAFDKLRQIVADCLELWEFSSGNDVAIAGLLLATMQGLFSQEASGRLNAEKGQMGVRKGMKLMVDLLSRRI